MHVQVKVPLGIHPVEERGPVHRLDLRDDSNLSQLLGHDLRALEVEGDPSIDDHPDGKAGPVGLLRQTRLIEELRGPGRIVGILLRQLRVEGPLPGCRDRPGRHLPRPKSAFSFTTRRSMA